jgi:membrane-associated phospholipid phosphatase
MNGGRSLSGRKSRVFRLPLLLALILFAAPVGLLRAQEEPDCTAVDQEAPPPLPAGADPQEPPPPPAEPAPRISVAAALKDEANRYGRDSVALVKAPLSWNKKQWEKAAGAVLIVGGLMFADRDIDKAAQRQRSSFTDHLASSTAPLGSGYGFAISGGLFAAGLAFGHENLRDTGREAFEAGLLAIAVDQVLKRAFGRERIADSGGRTVLVPGSSHDSFPSGHTTEAFAVASVIAARSKGWEIPVIAYAAATLVGLDRINTRDHFASDVVAGAFLGTTVGRFIVRRHGDEKAGVLSKADLEIVPIRHGLAARIRM